MIEKINMSSDECETIINYSQFQIGEWAELYTTDKLVMKRYKKYMKKYPEACRLVKEDKYSMTFQMPPKLIGIYPRAPHKARQFTEEEKAANAERLRQMRAAQKKNA